MTPDQVSELTEQLAAITNTFDTPWQACEDFGDISVRTADSMPGFYTEVFRTSQLMGHDAASPLAEFLINVVNRLPDLLARLKAAEQRLHYLAGIAREADNEIADRFVPDEVTDLITACMNPPDHTTGGEGR